VVQPLESSGISFDSFLLTTKSVAKLGAAPFWQFLCTDKSQIVPKTSPSLKTIYGLAIDLNDLFTFKRLTSSCNHVCYSLLPHHFNNQFNRAPAIQIGQNLGLGGNMPFLSASLTITLAILDSFFSCSLYGSSSKAVCF
jgi:hypothetical protein